MIIEKAICDLCGFPMPAGQEMFRYHGSDGKNCSILPEWEPAYMRGRPALMCHSFKHTKVLKQLPKDYCLCDPEYCSTCGYMSMREVAILHAIAREVRGWWTEMGGHTGWSAAHVAAAGNDIITVDPDYTTDMLQRAAENVANAGLARFVNFFTGTSDQFFARFPEGRFQPGGMVGCVIDGHHTTPHPLNDAKNAILHLAPQGVIFFHDYSLASVKEAVQHCINCGFQVRVWNTMNGVAACWRGDLKIPEAS